MDGVATASQGLSRWVRVSVGFAAVAVVGALMPATATAAPTVASAAATAGPDYLALGDSIAFGYTPPQTTPPNNYNDAKNFVGYPEDIARVLDLSLANASCPGETTGSLIVDTAASNGCENLPGASFGYRTVFPLHVEYPNSQLSYAVGYLRRHPTTKFVSIGIGGNDFGLCQVTTADHCTGADFAAMLHQLTQNLTIIFATLRIAANYRGPLVTVTYYSGNYADPVVTGQVNAVNAATVGPTKQFGGLLADAFGLFERASAPYGGSPCAAGLLIPLPTGGCDGHPTTTGQLVLAQAVERVFVDHS